MKNIHGGLMKKQRGWKAKMNWLTGDSKKWLQNHRKLACTLHVAGDSVKGQWFCVLNESSTKTKAQNRGSGTERMLKVLAGSFCY